MQILLWAECQKLRRSNILMLNAFAIIFIAVIVLIGGKTTVNGVDFSESSGWYMATTLTWATMFVLPAMIALLGSYMICREDQDDTAKSLHLIPVSKAKLTAAKMIVTFVFSILIYLLLFITTFSAEAVLHFSGLSVKMVLRSLKMYLLEGAGVFLAVSPIIAIVPYMKKSYWLAMLLAEIYSFAGLFMSMSNTLKTFYPITAVFGVSGYYEASIQNRICSAGVLLLCACLAIILLIRLNSSQKGKIHDEETI
ncbi:ABC transporter permease [Clostridiales bacterium]|jgi:bacitracin transport system permease protein|nr:ABC transporter permease [Clostridiales bacterium]